MNCWSFVLYLERCLCMTGSAFLSAIHRYAVWRQYRYTVYTLHNNNEMWPFQQVVTLATYAYFLGCVFARQKLDPAQAYKGHGFDYYVPIFTVLQVFEGNVIFIAAAAYIFSQCKSCNRVLPFSSCSTLAGWKLPRLWLILGAKTMMILKYIYSPVLQYSNYLEEKQEIIASEAVRFWPIVDRSVRSTGS